MDSGEDVLPSTENSEWHSLKERYEAGDAFNKPTRFASVEPTPVMLDSNPATPVNSSDEDEIPPLLVISQSDLSPTDRETPGTRSPSSNGSLSLAGWGDDANTLSPDSSGYGDLDIDLDIASISSHSSVEDGRVRRGKVVRFAEQVALVDYDSLQEEFVPLKTKSSGFVYLVPFKKTWGFRIREAFRRVFYRCVCIHGDIYGEDFD